MKTNIRYFQPIAFLAAGLIIMLSACLKKSDEIPVSGPAIPFQGQDLVKTLSSQASLHLFNLAVNRLSLAASINANSSYTIFAPTDSAMKANGLDSAGIVKLNIDSLRQLISYQIGLGTFDDNLLSNNITTLQILTLRRQSTMLPSGAISTVSAPLYVKETGKLYFNGVPVNKTAPAIPAYNGYIYPVSGFMARLSARTITDIISTDPDLSMFNQAVAIADSVFIANAGLNIGDLPTLFTTLPTAGRPQLLPTVFAPTNKAFNDAGFHTADDLRNFASRYPPTLDFNDFATITYSSLDSLLGRHILFNDINPPYNVRVLYNDLLGPLMNNGVYNTYVGGFTSSQLGIPGEPSALKFKTPLIFSAKNGIAYVKWTNDPKLPQVAIPLDANPLHPVNNYVASNGAVYKIDKLFYPIVNN
ncbi:Fasciclin domain-containing protein [Mucilaginibacter pineti]|uniref:Fasciclin domain-containing protein n=1 Tax=Mucilaginibacter pineti TaxID=1391627 RepID=A0A1G6XL21_9SPHI|nr:fasciclin domain-containing protein [Mucilaginibacter pineti]SDD77926.1 Fasciclin domain-containing protein [Mucilaginibacter pineti]